MFLRRGFTSKHLQKQKYKKLGKPPNFITLFNGKWLGRVKMCHRWHFSPLQKG